MGDLAFVISKVSAFVVSEDTHVGLRVSRQQVWWDFKTPGTKPISTGIERPVNIGLIIAFPS